VKVASGLASGLHPTPDVAEAAVRSALQRADLSSASHVVLLLSHQFARQPAPAILAAARAAGCLQVAGCTASGLFTEEGWEFDQPAAAAMVFTSSAAASMDGTMPTLSFSGHGTLPYGWQTGAARAGLLEPNAAVWAHGRVSTDACGEFSLPGRCLDLSRASGLRQLGDMLPATLGEAYELRRVGGHTAFDSLCRALPPELREQPPLHHVSVLRQGDEPPVAILAANADGSLTLAGALTAGENIAWAIRQPLAAEQEIRGNFRAAAERGVQPDFALMFSCIGRGPLFYGNDDHDLLAFREQFPATPLLGAYGSGQIAPLGQGNRLFHNSAITLLFASADV